MDFSQAYDLFKVLQRLGCGAVMLAALVAMYSVTNNIIGTAMATGTVGVCQGSPSFCLLFILFVNDQVKLIKENCNPDRLLSWFHILILMDDTVLLATNKENLIHKMSLLKQYCNYYSMKIHMSVFFFFFVICSSEQEKETIHVDGVVSIPIWALHLWLMVLCRRQLWLTYKSIWHILTNLFHF